MKDYNQMAQEVFRRRDEYLAVQKKKRAMLLKAGVPLCALVLVVLLGVTIRMNNLPDIPTLPTQTTNSTTDITEEVILPTDTSTNSVINTESQGTTEVYISEPVPFFPTDPVEIPIAKPDTPQSNQKPIVDATANNDGSADAPPCSPDAPMATAPPSMEEPDFIPDSPNEFPLATESPTVGGADQEYPTVDATEAPQTQPATGPLDIIVNGEKCTVQVGDMVTYTAELYVKDLFESFAAAVVHSDSLEVVEVVNPREEDPAPVHYPNLTGGDEILNYHYWRNNKDGKPRVYVLGSKLSGYNFKEQKVLFTFSFIAVKPGEAEIALEIHDLCKKGDGTPYFKNKEQLIFEGISCEEYLTVTSADEVVLPTAPKDEEESVPPFTYPEESTDGELLIHADGRTYAADIGQRITYVVELEAKEKFEDAEIVVTYGDNLDLLVPEATDEKEPADFVLPNMPGAIAGFNKDYEVNSQVYTSVKISAGRVSKYDFRKRKVMLQLDFIVAEAGEVDIDLIIKVMTIDGMKFDWRDPHKDNNSAYFYNGEQLIFEGIEFYEYVIVH